MPWEGGWSATVNGQPAQIVKVNVGFMAVEVPAGTAEIRFDYRTPGFTAGAAVTAVGFAGLGVYVWVSRRHSARTPETKPAASDR